MQGQYRGLVLCERAHWETEGRHGVELVNGAGFESDDERFHVGRGGGDGVIHVPLVFYEDSVGRAARHHFARVVGVQTDVFFGYDTTQFHFHGRQIIRAVGEIRPLLRVRVYGQLFAFAYVSSVRSLYGGTRVSPFCVQNARGLVENTNRDAQRLERAHFRLEPCERNGLRNT